MNLKMQQTGALVVDTFREALARKIFWGLFGLSTLLIIFFLFVMKIDIVEGAVATVSIFGKTNNKEVNLTQLTHQVFSFIATFLYTVDMFLALFASAGLTPSLLEPGRIELLLSKPIGRAHLLLGRFFGNLLIVSLNTIYLVLSVWLMLSIKTGIWTYEFLWTIPASIFMFTVLLPVVVLLGVFTESTALATMVPAGLMIISPILAQNKIAERLLDSEWSRNLWNAVYYVLPKVHDIGRVTLDLVGQRPTTDATFAVWTSAAFGGVVLATSIYAFIRRDY